MMEEGILQCIEYGGSEGGSTVVVLRKADGDISICDFRICDYRLLGSRHKP